MGKMKESKKVLDKLITKMANQILQDLPGGWTHVVFGMFRTEREGEEYLVYTSSDEGKTWNDLVKQKYETDEDMDGLEDAMDTCWDVFELCRDEGDNWSNMTFRMDNTGKFGIEFGYGAISHVNDAVRLAWRQKELHV